MIDLEAISSACAIIVDPDAADGFAHRCTAWSVGPGEWVTVWNQDLAPSPAARIICAHNGVVAALEGWEQEDDSCVAGFRSAEAERQLSQAPAGSVHKRAALTAVGYPSVIDHPLFRLHRPSLDVDRYLPYLCPWSVVGHCCLFGAEDGYLTGGFYPGMEGGPVLNEAGAVVGMLLDGCNEPGVLPLARFLRLG